MPKLTLPRKVILLFALSIVPAAIGIIFCDRLEILLPAIFIVLLNFGFAVKMLLKAMKDFNEAIAVIRKISYGEGVERVFPLYSPRIDSIELVRRGSVRRAKLYYLRDRRGKSARISERTTGHGIEARETTKSKKAKASEA